MTEVGVSDLHSEHDEMLPLIHCVNDVGCACGDYDDGSNDDVAECGLERVSGLPFEVVVPGRRGDEKCP